MEEEETKCTCNNTFSEKKKYDSWDDSWEHAFATPSAHCTALLAVALSCGLETLAINGRANLNMLHVVLDERTPADAATAGLDRLAI